MKIFNNKEKRILLILWPSPTNPDLTIKKINEIAVKMDHTWKLFALKGNLQKQLTKKVNLPCLSAFFPVRIFGSHKNIGSRILYFLSCIIKGVQLVKKEDIHVITQHDGHLEYGLVAYIISKLTHRKCLIRVNEDTLIPLIFFLKSSGNILLKNETILNTITLMYRRVEKLFFKRVDWIITHGPMDYEKIKSINNNITFVPLWVDLKIFKRFDLEVVNTFRTKFVNKKDNMALLLFVGRLHPEKGVTTLLKSLNLIKNINFMLLMIYSFSEYKEEFERLAEQLEISEKVLFYGYVPHHKLAYFYNSADLCILPSLREQWSNTLMESMACKTPIIVTEVGANPYLVADGKSGFLVPPNDPLKLAQKIKFVLENPDFVKQVTETAAFEIKKYDYNVVGESFKKVVTNLLK